MASSQNACVSILILLELPFDNLQVTGIYDMGLFQSLFYWNCRLIRRSLPHPGRYKGVSILILLELPFDSDAHAVRSRVIMFQSLFYWNCRLMTRCPQNPYWLKGFNPYFIGIAV